jgi:hypothetical protein
VTISGSAPFLIPTEQDSEVVWPLFLMPSRGREPTCAFATLVENAENPQRFIFLSCEVSIRSQSLGQQLCEIESASGGSKKKKKERKKRKGREKRRSFRWSMVKLLIVLIHFCKKEKKRSCSSSWDGMLYDVLWDPHEEDEVDDDARKASAWSATSGLNIRRKSFRYVSSSVWYQK